MPERESFFHDEPDETSGFAQEPEVNPGVVTPMPTQPMMQERRIGLPQPSFTNFNHAFGWAIGGAILGFAACYFATRLGTKRN